MKKIFLGLFLFSILGFYPLIAEAEDFTYCPDGSSVPLSQSCCNTATKCETEKDACKALTSPAEENTCLAGVQSALTDIPAPTYEDKENAAAQAAAIATTDEELKKLKEEKIDLETELTAATAGGAAAAEAQAKLDTKNDAITAKETKRDDLVKTYDNDFGTSYSDSIETTTSPPIDPDDLKSYNNKKSEESKKIALVKSISETIGSNKVAIAIQNLAKESGNFDVSTLLRARDEDKGNNIAASGETGLTLSGDNDKTNILTRVIKLLIQFLGTIAILLYVIAAFFMMTSQGDENQLQKGKTIFLYTTIGLAVSFTSYILVQFVLSLIFN